MAQRSTVKALEWYAGHQTTAQIGFNPNGMCLKVCRTARNIGSMYPSALAAQLATPKSKRVTELNKIQRGMVMYFDDPKDSNPYGHIVTVQSRATTVRNLDDIVVWTNSVKSGALVKVKASYFPVHWGDAFQFAATWLNGVDLLLEKAQEPLPLPDGPGLLSQGRGPRLRHAIADIEAMIEYHKARGRTRFVAALQRDLKELKQTLAAFD